MANKLDWQLYIHLSNTRPRGHGAGLTWWNGQHKQQLSPHRLYKAVPVDSDLMLCPSHSKPSGSWPGFGGRGTEEDNYETVTEICALTLFTVEVGCEGVGEDHSTLHNLFTCMSHTDCPFHSCHVHLNCDGVDWCVCVFVCCAMCRRVGRDWVAVRCEWMLYITLRHHCALQVTMPQVLYSTRATGSRVINTSLGNSLCT